MKNTCIVLRNVNSFISAIDFEPVVDACISGGFVINKVIMLPFDDVSLLCESITVEKNDCDNIIIVADGVLLQSLKGVLSKFLDKDFLAEYILVTDECNYFVCPAGKGGAEIIKAYLLPYLIKKFGVANAKLVIRMVGAPMNKIQSSIADASALSRNTLGFNVNESFGDIRLDVIYDMTTPKILLDEVTRIFASNLKDYIYSIGEDKSLEFRLYEALTVRRMKISVAESFTGGGVAQRLVSVPGISCVYFEGINSYSNDSKISRLNVAKSTLFEYGAVSDETAYEMAAGLIATGNCDIAISTTGIAGPDSDGTDKPVGLCYIGVGLKEQVYVYKFKLSGDRDKITKTAINYALFQALRLIK